MKTTFLAVLSVILFERAYPQNKFVNTADGQPMHASAIYLYQTIK